MVKRGKKISIALLLCSPLIAASYLWLDSDGFDLAKVHDGIELQFTEVNHVDGDGLSVIGQENIILFDVREPSEFTVSHLKDAIRIDPDISTQSFAEEFSNISKGKTVIFYCSVGQRSSDLANRVQGALISSGAKASYNLEGGIFKWHNERRPLYSSSANPTEYVHPYNSFWGRMVDDQTLIQY